MKFQLCDIYCFWYGEFAQHLWKVIKQTAIKVTVRCSYIYTKEITLNMGKAFYAEAFIECLVKLQKKIKVKYI